MYTPIKQKYGIWEIVDRAVDMDIRNTQTGNCTYFTGKARADFSRARDEYSHMKMEIFIPFYLAKFDNRKHPSIPQSNLFPTATEPTYTKACTLDELMDALIPLEDQEMGFGLRLTRDDGYVTADIHSPELMEGARVGYYIRVQAHSIEAALPALLEMAGTLKSRP